MYSMNSANHAKTLKEIKRFYFFLFAFIFVISQLFLNLYTVNYIEKLLIKQRLEQNQQMLEMAFDALKNASPDTNDYETLVPVCQDMASKRYFSSESFICAIDSNGYIVAHPDSKRIGLYRGREQIKTASGFRPFVGETYLVEGIWDNQAFSTIEIVSSLYDEETKFTLAAHQNKSLMDKKLLIVRLYFIFFSVLIFGVLFVIGWLLTRSVVGKLTGQIEQHEHELESFNTELEKRVAERTGELAKINQRLLKEIDTRQKAEERSRSLYTKAPVMLHSIDADGKLMSVSDYWLENLGYELNEVIGHRFREFMAEASRQRAENIWLPEFLKTGYLKDIELQFVKKNGEKIDVLLSAVAERDAKGQILRSMSVLIDVTERKKAEEALKKAHDELEIRVQERTAELSEANELLESKNEELETFAYSVSHDLRAPLRSIDGFSQALLEDCGDNLNEYGKDYLNRVRAASQRMGNLIDDMLYLSRVSKREMIREEVDLSAVAKTIAQELQEEQPERQVAFVIAPEVKVCGDAHLLRIVLENLLDNAWKYTAKHPRAKIEFGVTAHEGKKTYFVRDDGAGFDSKFAGKLFGPFQRLHRSNEFEGNGIGLATVQRIIHRHGGRVWAEGAVEKGATFFFTLP